MNRYAMLSLAAVVLGARAGEKETPKVDVRVFEMRTYYAEEGKMSALHARFRDHTLA